MMNASPTGPARDPVCGMMVDPATAAGHLQHGGQTYHFCCTGCLERFRANPASFLQPLAPSLVRLGRGPGPGPQTHERAGPPAPPRAPPGTTWICPMDPEVRQDPPGACPKCGMALEPEAPSAAEADNPELRDMTRRLWIAGAITSPLLVLAMGAMGPLPAFRHWLASPAAAWLQLALATPVVLWAGLPFFARAWTSLRNRSPNMFTLIGLGVGVAYGYSAVAVLAPGLFPPDLARHDGRPAIYFESAAVIVTLVLVGLVLELRARGRTGAALRALLRLTPKTARRRGAGGPERAVPLEQLAKGDPLTAATRIGTGALLMRAERVGAATLLGQIVRMVSEAQRSRAPIQRLADRVSRLFVPAVVLAAVITFVVWAAFGPAPRLGHALVNAVAVLIIACPCALGLAAPMSVMVATGKAATLGVLFRNAEAIEALRDVDTLVVDKTGTLTEGKPRLTGVVTAAGVDEAGLLAAAAAVERGSEHPLGAAIVTAAEERGLAVKSGQDFRATPGQGVMATVAGHRIALGTAAFLDRQGITQDAALDAEALARRSVGETVLFAAHDGRAVALLALADPPKATAAEALGRLRDEGLRIVMLTGDHRDTALATARKLGNTEVIADVLPQDKAAAVERLQREGRVVAMAGDGINDAPALARAHVGIAMGTGTDVAMQPAAVTLVKGDLRGIARARAGSRATLANIRQNLAVAFVYNALGIPLAAGVLYPAFGWTLNPMLAAAAMSLSSVSVIGTAQRLRHTAAAGSVSRARRYTARPENRAAEIAGADAVAGGRGGRGVVVPGRLLPRPAMVDGYVRGRLERGAGLAGRLRGRRGAPAAAGPGGPPLPCTTAARHGGGRAGLRDGDIPAGSGARAGHGHVLWPARRIPRAGGRCSLAGLARREAPLAAGPGRRRRGLRAGGVHEPAGAGGLGRRPAGRDGALPQHPHAGKSVVRLALVPRRAGRGLCGQRRRAPVRRRLVPGIGAAACHLSIYVGVPAARGQPDRARRAGGPRRVPAVHRHPVRPAPARRLAVARAPHPGR